MSLTTPTSRLVHVLRLGAVFLPGLTACSGSDDDKLSAGDMDAGGRVDGGSGDGSTPSLEDGGGTGPDGGTGPGDGTVPDGATDPDASTPRGPMDFTLHYNRRPVPNAVVVLHDASGAAIESLNTDALGQVHPAVAPHMLTVLPPPDFLELMEGGPISYLGVQPGDDLFIDLDQIGVENPSEGSYSVSLPSLVNNANLYFVSANSQDCGNSAGDDGQFDDAFPMYTKCSRPQGVDVFAVAQQAGTGPLRYAYAKDQPVPAAGSVQELALTEWVDPDQVTISVSNADVENPPYVDVVSYRNGGRYWTGASEGTPAGTNAWQYATALGFFDSLGFTASFSTETVNESVYSQLELRTLPSNAQELDATWVLPPVRVAAFDITTPTRPIMTIAPEVPGTSDAIVLNLEFNAELADGSMFYTFWTFVAPPDAADLQLPDLSVYAAHLGTTFQNATNITPRLLGSAAYEIDTVPNYDAFRQLPVDFTSYIEGQSFDVRRPTPSLLRMSSWRGNDG